MNANADPSPSADLLEQIRELDNREFFCLLLCLSEPRRILQVTDQFQNRQLGYDARAFAFQDLRAFLIVQDTGADWKGTVYLLRSNLEVDVVIDKLSVEILLDDAFKATLAVTWEQNPPTPLKGDYLSGRDSENLVDAVACLIRTKRQIKAVGPLDTLVNMVKELEQRIEQYRVLHGDRLVQLAYKAAEDVLYRAGVI